MTNRWLRIVVVVVCSLLAFATSAHAECAWVLWWENTTSSFSYRTADANLPGGKAYPEQASSWNILGSYPTNAACERQQVGKIADMLKMWRKEKADAKFGEHTITYESGSNIISKRSSFVNENTSTYSDTIRYLCLPDTIDPRGPKGK